LLQYDNPGGGVVLSNIRSLNICRIMSMLFLIFRLINFIYTSPSDPPFDIAGLWKEDILKDAVMIRISKSSNGLFHGFNVTRQGSSYVSNSRILWDLSVDQNGQTYMGKMKPPDRDITLDVVIRPVGRNGMELTASKFIVRQTKKFIRINESDGKAY
jgi:hypothetical protein